MELSGLIFVALAVAWAAYLIPKALQHHDEVVRSRSVERFSQRMRVLARREPVDRRNARLVVTPGRATSAPVVTMKGATALEPAPPHTRVEAIRRATRRRRRVLGLLLLAVVAVGGLAAFSLVDWWWTAVPGGLLIAWLVACRLMVRQERGIRRPATVTTAVGTAPPPVESQDEAARGSAVEETVDTPAIADPVVDPRSWDPLPVTLPTYVSKPAAAQRTVRTIDLDATGVWSSGRSEGDSALAREADEAERSRRDKGDGRRAVGT